MVGPALKLSLMKLVVAKGVRLRKGHNDVNMHWTNLISDLLRQPEWKFLADQLPNLPTPLETRIFKDVSNSIIDDISKNMGWGKYAGTTGNLSGKEGDLDEITTLVRQIIFDWDKKKEEKESGKALQEELNQNEMMVMTKKIQKACKGKRKRQSGTDEEVIRELGVEMMLTLFSECDVKTSKEFRDEMKTFKVSAAAAMKMFMFFSKILKADSV